MLFAHLKRILKLEPSQVARPKLGAGRVHPRSNRPKSEKAGEADLIAKAQPRLKPRVAPFLVRPELELLPAFFNGIGPCGRKPLS